MPPSPYIPLLVSLLFLSGHSHGSPYAHDNSSCVVSFFCGEVNISYPFYLWDGTSAASYCGYPGLGLTCRPDNTTILQMKSDNYTVTSIDYNTRSMLLADTDVLTTGGDCPKVSHNVTFTPRSPFNYTDADDYLVFFFGCFNLYPPDGVSAILCDRRGFPEESYVFREDQIPPGVDVEYWARSCHSMLVAPVLGDILKSPKAPNLTSWYGEVLMHGFELSWQRNNIQCEQCESTKGRCGYTKGGASATDYVFRCFCPDGLDCGSQKSRTGIIIGASVGGAAVCFFAFLGLFLYKRKRRQKKVTSSSKLLKYTGSGGEPRPKDDVESGSVHDLHTHLFTYEELVEATDGFKDSRELGDGGFGTVYKGKLRDGRVVAVKRLYEHSFRRVEQFVNEAAILSRLRHPNLVAFYGCTSSRSRELLLVYEFVPNGTVADHLHGPRATERALSWPRRLSIAVEAADALAYLHAVEPPIVHRDVKTNNILLDADFHVKVADFGLSRLFPLDATHVSTAPQGTPGYVDPEYHQCFQLTDKSDVYSFGVVLVELISSKPAVDIARQRNEINLASMAISKIQRCQLEQLVDLELGYESDPATKKMMTMVAELAFRCLQHNGEMRPPIKEVLDVLRGIQEGCNMSKDAGKDAGLLKIVAPNSPDTVTVGWDSRTTTPNTSQ